MTPEVAGRLDLAILVVAWLIALDVAWEIAKMKWRRR